MKKVSVFVILVFSLIISSCQNSQRKGLIDKTKDNEFINGSNIHLDSCNAQTSQNLAQLCKIWGFLKYYHPTVASGESNWDFELFRAMQSVLNSPSKADREKYLNSWIQRLGEVKRSDKPFAIDSGSVKIYPAISWIEDSLALGKVSKQLIEIKFTARSEKHYYVDIKGNMNAQFKNESAYSSFSYPDTGYRLLALFRYWNIIQYYYPYRYLIEDNWDEVLTRFIPLFIQAKDRTEYMNVLLKLIVCIGDTHATLSDQSKTSDNDKKYRGAADISFVEGKAIVVKNESTENIKNSGLEVGDIILTVDGKSVEEIASKRLPEISASNYPTKLRQLAVDLLVTDKERLYIEFDRNGKRQSGFILCTTYRKGYEFSRMKQDKPLIDYMTPQDILYLYLGSQKGGTIPKTIQAKGIILDLRCHPTSMVKGYWDFEQLYPSATGFAKATSPSIKTPGLFSFSNVITVGKKNPDYFKGIKVVLINEFSQSHAELMAMKYSCAPHTVVIGSTTAGADGNVSNFVLPGGIFTSISGMGVYYPDGRETQKIGIIPDIEVRPTIKGVRSGRDEVLDKAVKLIVND